MTDTAVPQSTSLHDVPVDAIESTRSRRWVLAGLGAAVASVVGIGSSMMSGAVYEP